MNLSKVWKRVEREQAAGEAKTQEASLSVERCSSHSSFLVGVVLLFDLCAIFVPFPHEHGTVSADRVNFAALVERVSNEHV